MSPNTKTASLEHLIPLLSSVGQAGLGQGTDRSGILSLQWAPISSPLSPRYSPFAEPLLLCPSPLVCQPLAPV